MVSRTTVIWLTRELYKVILKANQCSGIERHMVRGHDSVVINNVFVLFNQVKSSLLPRQIIFTKSNSSSAAKLRGAWTSIPAPRFIPIRLFNLERQKIKEKGNLGTCLSGGICKQRGKRSGSYHRWNHPRDAPFCIWDNSRVVEVGPSS